MPRVASSKASMRAASRLQQPPSRPRVVKVRAERRTRTRSLRQQIREARETFSSELSDGEQRSGTLMTSMLRERGADSAVGVHRATCSRIEGSVAVGHRMRHDKANGETVSLGSRGVRARPRRVGVLGRCSALYDGSTCTNARHIAQVQARIVHGQIKPLADLIRSDTQDSAPAMCNRRSSQTVQYSQASKRSRGEVLYSGPLP